MDSSWNAARKRRPTRRLVVAIVSLAAIVTAAATNAGGDIGQPCERLGVAVVGTICFHYYDRGIPAPGDCRSALKCYFVVRPPGDRSRPNKDEKNEDASLLGRMNSEALQRKTIETKTIDEIDSDVARSSDKHFTL